MLNSEQLRAVHMSEGPCLIIAGAGTGKTMTIVEKLTYLIDHGVPPEKVLALTFSNEAAEQMKTKVEDLTPEARHIHISTFHSFCDKFIRAHTRECNVGENYNILEELDGAILLKRELDLDVGRAKRYANTIGKAKDLSLTIDDYRRYLQDQENLLANYNYEYDKALVILRTIREDLPKEERKKLMEFVKLYENYLQYKEFLEAWIKYEELKKKSKSLDFADLNMIVLDYVSRYGAEELAVYDYIVVDEFQDTNKVQFELLLHLAKRGNITVVGDQNQTVYAFRGAYADNIEKFRKVFRVPDENVIKLSTNYRSSDKILRTAHKLITNNYVKPEESVLLSSAESIEGEDVRIVQLEDNKEQARRIVEEIEKLQGTYKDIAILYRSHSSAGAIKRALNQRGIPYSTAGGTEFFHKPEIKTALSFIYILNNLSSSLLQAEQAWWRLLHTRFGLTAADSTILADFKKKKRLGLQDLLYNHIDATRLSAKGKQCVKDLTALVDDLKTKTARKVSDLVLEIYDRTGLAREYSSDREAMQNIKLLIGLSSTFETFHGADLANFITYLEMVDEMGGGMPSTKIIEEESVKLMTIHAAKGLEFKTVFLVDMVKDKFPLTRGGAEPLIPQELNEQYNEVLSKTYRNEKEKETAIKELTKTLKEKEERRLCYVGLTRAKENLILTLAKDYGGKDSRDPSGFLFEVGAKPQWFSQKEIQEADLHFTFDKNIRANEARDTDIDRLAADRKKIMMNALETGNTKSANYHMLVYQGLINREPVGKGAAAKEVKRLLDNAASGKTGLKFNPNALTFSVTSTGTYLQCPKKYELKHVLNMPSREDEEGEGAFGFGSIMHDILDLAAKNKLTKEETKELIPENIDIERAKRIIDVFWHRHEKRMRSILETELPFNFRLGGFAFRGKIDRIDYLGDGKVRIIDYKTGYTKTDVPKDDRERQLLLYALALQNDETIKKNNWIPTELVLDMLEKEKPLEFTLENGIMTAPGTRIKEAKVEDIRKNVLEICQKIAHDYEHGFSVAESDTPCKFCSYKLYCPKWG